VNVRLAHGAADLPAFTRAARTAAGDVGIEISPLSRRAKKVSDATHLQAVALYAFAGLALLGCVVIAGQALVRQLALDAADHSLLRSLGMTNRALALVAMLRAALVVAAAGVAAVGGAVAASSLFPIGLGRQAEPHAGMAVNVAVLGVGVVVLAVALLARAGVAIWLTAGARRGPGERPSRVADALARAGSPPSAVTGVRLALQPGRGTSAVPLRSTLGGSAIAIAAIAMALTFGASLDHLLDTPRLQGWNWDVTVGNPHVLADPQQNAKLAPRVRAIPGVAEVSMASFSRLTIGGSETSVVGIGAVEGSVFPPITDGRDPHAPDEIALGSKLLDRLHLGVGDLVAVKGRASPRRLRIVGIGVFPTAVASTGDVEGVPPGDGAVMTLDGMRRFDAESPVHQLLVRYGEGADPAAVFRRLEREFGSTILRPLRSSDIRNMATVAWMPYTLAGLLLAFALTAVGHVLVTSVRRRRHDLAVLKTLGFVRGQVSSTVAWQASTLVALALLVGVPVGVVLGRAAWRLAAGELGLAAEPVEPLLLALGLPAAFLVANLIAAGPAWVAGRIHPALVLRTE
jgi:hypothetical protein